MERERAQGKQVDRMDKRGDRETRIYIYIHDRKIESGQKCEVREIGKQQDRDKGTSRQRDDEMSSWICIYTKEGKRAHEGERARETETERMRKM